MNILNNLVPAIAKAQTTPPSGSIPSRSVSSLTDIYNIVNNIVNWIFAFFFVMAGIYILMAAFDYLNSGGDQKKIDGAKTKIIYAAIGIAVAILAKSLTVVIGNLIA
ncbi:MAG: hypothetical protein PHG66_01520 [Candidatus Colwellbacteria bacterium]|nr:hypothetical protein [Candidatus Colwellbacteria bacterium]